MNVLKRLKDLFRHSVFATIPAEYREQAARDLYHTNTIRFAAQSIVLVLMDGAVLLTYLVEVLPGGHILLPYLLVIAVKMAVNLTLFLYQSRRNPAYNDKNLLQRYSNVLYPALHGLLEFLLFAFGRQDLGALARFLAVPFIMGSITIMQQQRFLGLGLLYYLMYSVYLPLATHYSASLILPSFLVNLWPVVFLCASLVSFIIYSGYVNGFMHNVRARQSQRELERLNTQLDIFSRRDQLTGLSNRRDFDSYMELSWEKERNSGGSVSFVMLDIDYFKYYNDRFGHLAGDECLVQVTKAVQECLVGVRHMSVRYGGEEFLLVIYSVGHDEMVKLAEDIRQNVEALKLENPDSDISPFVTVSLGLVSCAGAWPKDYTPLVQLADECLYLAKERGRNMLVHLDGESRHRDAKNQLIKLEIPEENGGEGRYDAQHLQRVLKEGNLDCTFVYSRQHALMAFSPFAQEMLGTPSSIAMPTLDKIFDLLPLAVEENAAGLRHVRQTIDSRERILAVELCLQHGAEKNWVAVRGSLLYDEDGNPAVASGSFFRIQDLMAYSSYAYEQAMVSPISLLPNRNRFYSDMEKLLAAGRTAGMLVLFDIRNFKSVNSIFSHTIGDKALRKVGGLLGKLVAGDAQLYHYAVDQFILISKNTSKRYTNSMVERVLGFFATYEITIEGIPIRISFHVGAVQFSQQDRVLDEILINLDIALQKAKLQRGAPFCIFDEQDRAEYLDRTNLEKELVRAVEDNFSGFALHYQPLFTVQNHRCVGAEALLRFTTAAGAQVSPLVVVAMLEKLGLIALAGRWILQTALSQCKSWIAQGAGDDFYVHVNLSMLQLDKASFSDSVLELIRQTGLAPHNLVLEITESALMGESGQAVSIVTALRSGGIRIALDDFGTGYSSLSYLRNLPADEIKIDKSFLSGIEADSSAQTVLESIVELAKGMGYTVCIEGAETEAHMSALRHLPVDLLQGYLLGRPVPPAIFKERWVGSSGQEEE